MPYKFALLDPRPIPAAEAANAAILGPQTLGIEVTVPALAARCGLGNVDPQHSGGDAGTAAIETALVASFPSDGATIVTVRADLDAVGAMAILSLRKEEEKAKATGTWNSCGLGRAAEYDGQTSYSMRIHLVAEVDKFARGGWPGPRPLEFGLDDSASSVEDNSSLASIAAEVADFRKPIADRVAAMARWLLDGTEPEGRRAAWERERAEIAAALASGAIKTSPVAEGQIAVVESTHRAALAIGYRLAPVVVALNSEFRVQGGAAHRKFTVCQFELGHADLKSACAELATREFGWGGSPTIIGSPQGSPSTLSVDEIVEVVSRHLEK